MKKAINKCFHFLEEIVIKLSARILKQIIAYTPEQYKKIVHSYYSAALHRIYFPLIMA